MLEVNESRSQGCEDFFGRGRVELLILGAKKDYESNSNQKRYQVSIFKHAESGRNLANSCPDISRMKGGSCCSFLSPRTDSI